ncbi:MAG: DMT family transporter [Rhodocyclaceae bacterium]|jgi:drug/metabolite transporter (DMT)-like permease|nr:DMT family transporter [Rhodocyclaceae bacterium]
MPSLWMIAASFLFACMGVCVKISSAHFGVGELTIYRGLVALGVSFALLRFGRIPAATPHWRMQLSRGVAGSVALAAYYYAIGILPLATAVTLNYTSPIFVALILALWMRERVAWPLATAVLIGFAGVVLLLRPTLQADQWPGAAAGLLSGLIASVAYINVRELGQLGEPESRTVFWFSALTLILGLAWTLLTGGFHPVPLADLPALLGVGLFAALAQLAMTRSYRYGKTLVSANLAYSTVIFASLFGVVLWGEHLPVAAWLAIGLIILSGLVISLAANRPSGPVSQSPLQTAAQASASND